MTSAKTIHTDKPNNGSAGMTYLLWFFRIVVGGLFIFSGLVKANDPLGLSYKMDEFFEVWASGSISQGWKDFCTWGRLHALAFSVVMIAFEIISGVAIILGYGYRLFSFLILLLTIFFTFLTAYVYIPHEYPVLLKKFPNFFPKLIEECGCFGDCIKISNAETFWKDIVLLIIILILFLYRKRVTPVFKGYPSAAILVLTTFFAFGFQWWNLEHLPYHDCLPYKVGNNLSEKMKVPTGPGVIIDSFSTVLVYKDNNGKEKAFTTADYPWQDTLNWHFVDSKTVLVREGNASPPIKDFTISDYDKGEHTADVLQAKGYVFLFFLRDVDKARTDNLEKLKAMADQAEAMEIPTYILSSDTKERTEAFLKKHNLIKFPIFTVDATASKTGMRSNPGLMLLKDGTVQNKWSFRDYPGAVSMKDSVLTLK